VPRGGAHTSSWPHPWISASSLAAVAGTNATYALGANSFVPQNDSDPAVAQVQSAICGSTERVTMHQCFFCRLCRARTNARLRSARSDTMNGCPNFYQLIDVLERTEIVSLRECWRPKVVPGAHRIPADSPSIWQAAHSAGRG